MPNQGHPRHAFRFHPALWASFAGAVKRDPLDRNMSEVVHDLVGWYTREKPGEPVRPPRAPIDTAGQ